MDYQLIVIGAGPGGYVAAIRGAQLGLKTAVVENRDVGGTCLNRGCIPTKTLLHTAELIRELQTCEKIGVRVQGVSCDWDALYARKDKVVSQLRAGVEGLLQANNIDFIRGTAAIQDAANVRVGDRTYSTENILIAVGSIPTRLPIPGMDLPGVVTSDELLEQKPDCSNLTIIGGGVIGVEFATIFQSLGVQVTVLEAMDRILPGMDKEISQNLSMILKKRGIAVSTGAQVAEVRLEGNGLAVSYTAKGKSQSLLTEKVLVSTGRKANLQDLFGDSAQLPLDHGRIPVDSHFQTSMKGIYAVGDVVSGSVQLAHAASAQGINAVCAMCGKEPEMDLSVIPACVYTAPEIASVGLTAEDAEKAGLPVKTGKALMAANGKTLITMGERGFVKVVFHRDSEVLLGAQLMCGRATDLIGELAAAVRNRLTLEQLSAVIRAHPTFQEGISEALEAVEGRSIHSMPKKRMTDLIK